MVTKEKVKLLKEMVAAFKSVREAMYHITDMSNPYDRRVATKDACDLIHDITEQYKKLLRDAER